MVSTTQSISKPRRLCRVTLKVLLLALLFPGANISYLYLSRHRMKNSASAQASVMYILPTHIVVHRNADMVDETGSQPKGSHQKVLHSPWDF